MTDPAIAEAVDQWETEERRMLDFRKTWCMIFEHLYRLSVECRNARGEGKEEDKEKKGLATFCYDQRLSIKLIDQSVDVLRLTRHTGQRP